MPTPCPGYAAGTFDFPTSSGIFAVSGLGFQPQAVIMIGSNRAELDTLVTGAAGPGLFLSMNALDWDDGATIQSLCLAMNGNADAANLGYAAIKSPTGCIRMMPDGVSTGNVVEYRASTISFFSDGFQINVTDPAPGVRPIHWVAIGADPSQAVPFQIAAMNQNPAGTPIFQVAFPGFSTLVLGAHISNGGSFTQNGINGQAWWSWGSGHYPEFAASTSGWRSVFDFTEQILGTSIGTQGFSGLFVRTTSGLSAHDTSHVISSVGPAFIEGTRRHRPLVFADLTEFVNEGGGAANTYEHAIWWNGEGWADQTIFPAAGDTVEVDAPGNFDEFALVIFSHVNGPFPRTGGSAKLAFGYGILHPDYQGCVAFGQDGSFYQSTSKCAARTYPSLTTAEGDFVDASGVIPGKFTLTGIDGIAQGGLGWHGFGCPATLAFIPQMYRWWRHPAGA